MGKTIGAIVDEKVVPELLKRGMTEEGMLAIINRGGITAIDLLVNAFGVLVHQAKNIFCVFGDNRTTDEVVSASNYDENDARINAQNFPIRVLSIGQREIVLLDFNCNPERDEVLKEAKRQGLEIPLYEDAIFFGEKYPDEQRNGPVVFFHEPWRAPDESYYILVLDGDEKKRSLCLEPPIPMPWLKWSKQCLFAFIRN